MRHRIHCVICITIYLCGSATVALVLSDTGQLAIASIEPDASFVIFEQ